MTAGPAMTLRERVLQIVIEEPGSTLKDVMEELAARGRAHSSPSVNSTLTGLVNADSGPLIRQTHRSPKGRGVVFCYRPHPDHPGADHGPCEED